MSRQAMSRNVVCKQPVNPLLVQQPAFDIPLQRFDDMSALPDLA